MTTPTLHKIDVTDYWITVVIMELFRLRVWFAFEPIPTKAGCFYLVCHEQDKDKIQEALRRQ